MILSDLIDGLGTQVEAARKVGVGQSTICSWRSPDGSLPRGLLQIRALAQATGKTESEIQALVDAERERRRRGIPIDTPAQARAVLAERGHPVTAEA